MIRHAFAFGIAQSHAHATVGDAAAAIHLVSVGFAHLIAAQEAHFLNVAALVARCWESVVHPQERANLHFLVGLAQASDAVGCDVYNLAGTYVAVNFVIEIREACRLARHGISVFFLANDDWGAAKLVASGDNAVFGEQQH